MSERTKPTITITWDEATQGANVALQGIENPAFAAGVCEMVAKMYQAKANFMTGLQMQAELQQQAQIIGRVNGGIIKPGR